MARAARSLPRRSHGSLVTKLAIVPPVAALAGLVATVPDANGEMKVYEVKASLNAPIVDDNDAQFEQRHGIPAEVSGGVDELLAEWLTEGGRTVRLEGRSIFDNHDYFLKLGVDDPKKGRFDAGYEEFRTWYDGSGGFFPQNRAFGDFFNDEMALERGKAWFDGTLSLPDLPEISLKYAYRFRDGRKPSQTWGDTDMTGGFGTRSIVNAFTNLNEDYNSVDLDIKHRIRRTEVGGGFSYQKSDIENAHNIARQPGDAVTERFITQRTGVNSDLYNAHAFTESRFLEDKLTVTTAYAYTDLDADNAGSRVYGSALRSSFDPVFANRQPFDGGFLDLAGDTELKQHVGTINFLGRPRGDTSIRVGLRVEQADTDGTADFVDTSVGTPPTLTTAQTPLSARSSIDELTLSQDLDVRFTGLDNWVFYARGEWEEMEHDVREREEDAGSGTSTLDRKTDIDRFDQKYTAGFSWHPLRRLNIAAKYQYRFSDGDYGNKIDSTDNTSGNRYPAYITSQNFTTNGVDARISWRPRNNLRLTTRYDFRLTDIDTKVDGLRDIQSGEITDHIIGMDTNWSPLPSVYVNAAGSYVHSNTDTPANSLAGQADNLVTDYDNDYWNANLTAGWAVGEQIDLEARYFFFYSDNYKNNSVQSQPYGSQAEEHGVTVGMTFHASENTSWTAKYGYFTNDNDEAGGFNDYDAHFILMSLGYHF